MSKRLNLHLFLLDYGHFKHKDIFWFEPVKVMTSSFGNLDRTKPEYQNCVEKILLRKKMIEIKMF